MSPPKLARDRPVTFLTQPREVAFGITFGNNLYFFRFDNVHGRLGQRVHFDEPLIGEVRFDRRAGAIRDRHLNFTILDFFEQPKRFQVSNDFLTSLFHRQRSIVARFGVQGSVGVHDVDHR